VRLELTQQPDVKEENNKLEIGRAAVNQLKSEEKARETGYLNV